MAKVKVNKILDISGQRFGTLRVDRPTLRRIDGYIVWKCQCDCGKWRRVSSRDLKDGTVNDCRTGCWPSKRRKTQIATAKKWEEINRKRREKRIAEEKEKKQKLKEWRQKEIEGNAILIDGEYQDIEPF